MTDLMHLADAYDAAADYIEQNGWYQGGYYPHSTSLSGPVLGHAYTTHAKIVALGTSEVKPPMCMAGALGVFVTEEMWDEAAYRFTAEYGEYVADFNDDASRTQEEVTDLLRVIATKIRMGNIGDNPREYEFQPMPETVPVVEPAAPAPQKEPVPA